MKQYIDDVTFILRVSLWGFGAICKISMDKHYWETFFVDPKGEILAQESSKEGKMKGSEVWRSITTRRDEIK